MIYWEQEFIISLYCQYLLRDFPPPKIVILWISQQGEQFGYNFKSSIPTGRITPVGVYCFYTITYLKVLVYW